MQKDTNSTQSEFIPRFKISFLHPRYWGLWLGVLVLIIVANIPVLWRDPLLGRLGIWIGKFAKGARRRANINLLYCFPNLTKNEREIIVDKMFATALQTIVFLVETMIKNPRKIAEKVLWHHDEHLKQAQFQQRNIILLVPHGWGVDIPAMLLASQGIKMAAMFHNQKNPLSDWLWSKARKRFGGRLHARLDGIKPFISSIREGYIGYYLPDQDFGVEQSEFVKFFATYKATLPVIGRLMKVCKAVIIPLFPVYDAKNHILNIFVHPPMNDLADADKNYVARRMNEEVEQFVLPNPEQYTWILKLLKTRKEGETEPYLRKDLEL